MAFSTEVVEQAWKRSDATCECTRPDHGHWARCHRALLKWNRGKEGWGAWEAHHIGDPDDDSLSNCEILCWDCYQQIEQNLPGQYPEHEAKLQ